ncbi:MAG: hypothetical protein EXR69_04605 [Myxococcales bacterium]|nr:hypothetical protein [Myxococcales bacterium]
MTAPSESPLYTHVTVKTAHDQYLFEDLAFSSDFLTRLATLPDHGCHVVAYAIMSAHVHLLIAHCDDAGLSHAMMVLLGPVGWRANARVQEQGGVFTRPFHRKRVVTDAHLLHLPIYIHANPHPGSLAAADYGWRTSHRAWMQGNHPVWLCPGAVLAALGGRDAYLASLQDYIDRPRDRMSVPGELESVVTVVASVLGTHPSTLLDPARGGKRDRKLLALALSESLDLGAIRLGAALGVPRSTADRWVVAAAADPGLRAARLAIVTAIGARNG